MIKKKSISVCISEWGNYNSADRHWLEDFLKRTSSMYSYSNRTYEFNYHNKIKEIIAVFKIIYLIKDRG